MVYSFRCSLVRDGRDMSELGVSDSYRNFIETLDDCINQAYEQSQGDKSKFRESFLRVFSYYNGGVILYIPKNISVKTNTSSRNKLIQKEFNGVNHFELAQKYGLSVQWIYKIVKEK